MILIRGIVLIGFYQECDHFFFVLIEWKSSSVILIHIRGVFILNHIRFLSKYLRSARADPRFMPRLSRIYIYVYIYWYGFTYEKYLFTLHYSGHGTLLLLSGGVPTSVRPCLWSEPRLRADVQLYRVEGRVNR